MSDDNVIQFPPSALTEPTQRGQAFTTGTLDGDDEPMCEDNIHFFAARPGRCRCGTEFWELPVKPA